MFGLPQSTPRYSALASKEGSDVESQPPSYWPPRSTQRLSAWSIFSLASVTFLSVAAAVFFFVPHGASNVVLAVQACREPPVRAEWRVLDQAAKNEYISAVKCLSERPSRLMDNATLYDDFPFTHKVTARSAHKSAPFLSWHRYYTHVYESALRTECSFRGALPYWDWSLDASSFAAAPVWSASSGFGGNGLPDGAETVGGGSCVADGPFAGLEARFYDGKVEPHCLSRGFARGEELAQLTELVRPEVIARIMENERFDDFAGELEEHAHRFISRSVKGDFSSYTGPYDPIFFLHHANIDRIWWQWQQRGVAQRVGGHAPTGSLAGSAVLDMNGLAPNVPAGTILDTTGGMLCYQY